MDILDYLPIHSIERQICELRHIDFKPWSVISAEIPMSRSQVYRRYRMALDTLLKNQRVQAVMKEYEGEYDKYIFGRAGRKGRRAALRKYTDEQKNLPTYYAAVSLPLSAINVFLHTE